MIRKCGISLEVTIRTATADDFRSILPLLRQLWPGKEINTDAMRETFIRGVDSPMDELFCGVLGDVVVGFCAYAIVNNLWQEGRISYVYAMVVDEAHRGKGFGKRLINAAIDMSRQQGLKRMELDSAFHRLQVHTFYEKLGFDKRGFLFSYPL